jgi:8-oxo-dGTP pyrophosphatase MutT (NUDIX family)
MSPYTLRRRAARVVLLNGASQVLLLAASDPANRAKGSWWEIPGGGIDGNETSEEAARRELYEETGITQARMGPCVWTQHSVFDFAGLHFDQDEWVHLAWCDEAHDVQPAHLEMLEAAAFEGHRWWDLDQLLADPAPVLPHRLREFLPALVAGDLPDEPLDISHLA